MTGKTPIRKENDKWLHACGLGPRMNSSIAPPGLTKLGLQILHQMPGAGPIARITRDRVFFAFDDLGKWLTI